MVHYCANFSKILIMEKFTLINKDRSRIKVFEPFEDVSKPSICLEFFSYFYREDIDIVWSTIWIITLTKFIFVIEI